MTFLDTNVLIYSIDGKAPAKQVVAREIVVSAVRGGGFLISAQVLNEFSNIALLKLKLSVEEVRLPDNFDEVFDSLDGEVASLFTGAA